MCPQVYQRFQYNSMIRESEDCLHLNIYVPVDNRPLSMPVLVYIHGGEFQFGGKDFYRPDFLLQAGGVTNFNSHFIVITINYRLGVLGFLSTDDHSAPGNNGIRDQVLALQWVHENVGKFGGNPLNVTIMGHDAGGVSVSFHILNPEVGQYFTNAISISGSIFSPWAINDNPLAQARDFSYRFTCGYRQDQIVDCLRYQELSQLMSVSAERDWDKNRQPFWFRPVIDLNVTGSALLKDFPLNLYKSGQFNRKQYLLIITSQEGSLEYYLKSSRIAYTNSLQRKISYLIRPYLKYYTNEQIMASAFEYKYFNRTQRSLTIPYPNLMNQQSNFQTVKSQYTLNNKVNTFGYSPFKPGIGINNGVDYTELELNRQFCEMLGDFLYSGPMDYVARLHSAQAKTMFLVFDYVGPKSFGLLQNDILQQVSTETYGPTHFNDLFYLLPNQYDLTGLQGIETNVARIYTKFIAEFVLFGIPPTSQYFVYTAASPNYQLITRDGQMRSISASNYQGYRTTYLDFINNYINQLQNYAVIFPPYFPQQEFKSYQQATWSLLGILILFIVIALILAIVLIVKQRKIYREQKDDREQVSLKRRIDENLSD
ncbi:Esterase-6 [Sarcoptes scabiei]|uniref:Esterase-6 n=2 Tax=Sarcoptes scabiei TaxID=52283 RepID=A0A834RJU1_SARSC|nr:Esterase-6 [Sarcoptes scabiei]